MSLKYFSILGILILGLSSCGTCRYSEKSATKITSFEMIKTPCFGKCPVYKMFVFTDGTVLYEGLNFVEKEGLYTKQLTKAEYSNLCKVFSKSKWKKLNSEYVGDLPDLARTTITKHDKKSSKTVLAQYNIPNEFTMVEKELISIANNTKGWKKLSRGANTDNDWSGSEFIIKIKDANSMDQLIKKYADSELKLVKRIAPDLNYWIIGFNNQKIASSKIYYLLKQELVVEEIQFNRSIEMR